MGIVYVVMQVWREYLRCKTSLLYLFYVIDVSVKICLPFWGVGGNLTKI